MARQGIFQKLERSLIKSFVYICEGLVLVHRHFFKPRNVSNNIRILQTNMKATLSILILLIITNFGFSQNSTTNFEQKLYDEAISKINALDYLDIDNIQIENIEIESKEVIEYKLKVRQKINTEALEIFNKILDTLPNTKLLNKINYQIARIYFEEKNTKLASELYEKILKNSDPITDGYENEIRNSICRTLSKIYIENNDYVTALKYLEESKKYKIKFDCGNSAIESSKELEDLYQICQEGINKKK